jgi:hypothetical protein
LEFDSAPSHIKDQLGKVFFEISNLYYMLTRLKPLSQAFSRLFKPIPMTSIPKSPIQTSPGSPRAIKRQKLDHAVEGGNGEGVEMSEAEMVEREMALPLEYEKKYTHELDYRNKLVLAPMVRTGSCRLSCLDCGSDDS